MTQGWVILIYTVPAEPSRMRAAVWRDLKKAGAVYLRSGVAVIPQQPETLAAFEAIAAKALSFGGRATVVQQARLDVETAGELKAAIRADREAEFGDIQREAGRLLAHLREEHTHRDLTVAEREAIGADLAKLQRWFEQARSRNFFGEADPAAVAATLGACAEHLKATRKS